MALPKIFIGSSQKHLHVARLLANGLEQCGEITIWNEGVFGLNRGYLESLLDSLARFEFAVFVFGADDLTTGDDGSRPSARDNVLFESGLFMGVLGRERVFLVHDTAAGLRIPSDLAGVALAGYDGALLGDADGDASVRKACLTISSNITASRFPHLVGEWKSVYKMTFEEGHPLVYETIDISACRDGLALATKDSSVSDHYTAFGRVSCDRQIAGTWEDGQGKSRMEGTFILVVNPSASLMYGYFTAPDENGGIVYVPWALAKMAGVGDNVVEGRLRKARDMLKVSTVSEW